jgi:hypothetical protein
MGEVKELDNRLFNLFQFIYMFYGDIQSPDYILEKWDILIGAEPCKIIPFDKNSDLEKYLKIWKYRKDDDKFNSIYYFILFLNDNISDVKKIVSYFEENISPLKNINSDNINVLSITFMKFLKNRINNNKNIFKDINRNLLLSDISY